MRVAIYVRVSTDEQASSAEAQESGALAWCAARGHSVVATYRDIGHSGAEWVRRRGLLDLQLDAVRSPRPWEVLVVRDLDRLGRDQARLPLLLATLADHDVRVWEWSTDRAVELDVVGRMVAGVRAAMAELERESIAHRTRTALRQKAERGLCVGGAVYGYAHRRDPDGVRDVIDEAQAEVVREVYQRAACGESVRSIARDLNTRGVPSPRAGARGTGTWSPSALWEIVRNPRYRGRIIWGEVGASYKGGSRVTVDRTDTVERDDASLAIVDPVLWQRAQSDAGPVRVAQGRAIRRGTTPRHLLIGLAVCDHCGGPLGSARQLAAGASVPAYCCLWHRDRGDAACPAAFCRVAARLDAVVIDWLVKEVLDGDLIASAIAEARRLALSTEPDPHAEALRAEEREHALAVSRLTCAIEAGAGEVGGLVTRLAARARQLAEVRALLARESSAAQVVPIDLEARLRAVVADLREVLLADPGRAREVLAAVLVGRVRVSQPVKRGPVWLTAEAAPGALLASQEQRTGDTGYVSDPNGTATYPVSHSVRMHRQVA
jgi:DNA invertase Pin-like site-specific DNA recombinase